MTSLSIGFVGVGSMGQSAHLKNFVTLPDCRVVALSEPRSGLAEAVARKYNVPAIYADAGEMLENETLDGVVAIQPFDRHLQIISPLYECGLPILTEKPLAVSPTIGRRMLEALSGSPSWHMIGYHKRCDPASTRARELVRKFRKSGALGDVRYVRVTMPPGNWEQGGFSDLLRSSDEAPLLPPDAVVDTDYLNFVNFYIHQVNLIRFLIDESYKVTYADHSGILLVGKSESGLPVVIEMAPWEDAVGWNESAVVCFDRGWVKLDLPAPLVAYTSGRVSVHGDVDGTGQTRTVKYEPEPVHAMLAQASTFLSAIRGEASVPCSAEDAIVDLDIAEQYINLRGA